ncbi:ATP-binding cassette domain-containing protein [Vibrio sp. RC27]
MSALQWNFSYQGSGLQISEWNLEPTQHWGVFVTRSETAQSLSQLFVDSIKNPGDKLELPPSVAVVSLHLQQALLEDELANDDTDFLDRIDYGSTVSELLEALCASKQQSEDLMLKMDLFSLAQRGFRQLSTGETRRLMLARALAMNPEMLILDDPYVGMDTEHRLWLTDLLEELSRTLQLIVITSREDELPSFITHVALFDENKLTNTMTISEWNQHPVIQQLAALSESKSDQLVDLIQQHQHANNYPDPRVEMNQVKVEYTDGLIFKDLDWRIEAGQHWQVRGPNGCGKSTLLGLILGDHPQCYCNDISVLGMKRGSGETIWDIKKHIGIVSSSLHLQYRVNCQALDVLLSGFYDSIGLYSQPSTKEIQLAQMWLQAFEMSQYAKVSFKSLDYGQQRLLLIARALIKQPALLILDEPYQGLDYLNRKLVFHTLERIAELNITQLLYVTHYQEDAIEAINNYVDFYPLEEGGFQAVASHNG